jgi:hypothetical protein
MATAALLVLAVVAAACSGSSKSNAPATRSTTSGTQPAGAAGGISQVTTTIQMGSATAAVGSEAKAELKALAAGPPGLGAWTLEVAYDPTVVSVSGCTGTESSACNTHKDDHTVRFAGATASGLQGDVTLMTLTFQCKTSGTSPLTVNIVLLADATIGNPLAIIAPAQNGSITCS